MAEGWDSSSSALLVAAGAGAGAGEGVGAVEARRGRSHVLHSTSCIMLWVVQWTHCQEDNDALTKPTTQHRAREDTHKIC